MTEESLDPQDWEGMRALGHRMVDDMMSYLERVRERPVWQPIPADIHARFQQPVPQEPHAPEDVYREFLEYVLPYDTRPHERLHIWDIRLRPS
jgi:hypothetical protein